MDRRQPHRRHPLFPLNRRVGFVLPARPAGPADESNGCFGPSPGVDDTLTDPRSDGAPFLESFGQEGVRCPTGYSAEFAARSSVEKGAPALVADRSQTQIATGGRRALAEKEFLPATKGSSTPSANPSAMRPDLALSSGPRSIDRPRCQRVIGFAPAVEELRTVCFRPDE